MDSLRFNWFIWDFPIPVENRKKGVGGEGNLLSVSSDQKRIPRWWEKQIQTGGIGRRGGQMGQEVVIEMAPGVHLLHALSRPQARPL